MVEKAKLHGEDIVILEKLPSGAIVWISEKDIKAKEQSIKADVDDKMGYGKYKKALKQLGFDVEKEG